MRKKDGTFDITMDDALLVKVHKGDETLTHDDCDEALLQA